MARMSKPFDMANRTGTPLIPDACPYCTYDIGFHFTGKVHYFACAVESMCKGKTYCTEEDYTNCCLFPELEKKLRE